VIRQVQAAVAAVVVATTGCSVRGTDIRPAAPTPATAFESVDTALATAEPIDAWWTAFQDARLTSLVEQALGRSPDVRQATALQFAPNAS
jgi:outer membrane protein TolC